MQGTDLFTAAQMVDIAIQTEQTGTAFYTAAARSTEDPQIHALCEWLADQEKAHERAFRMMRDELGDTGDGEWPEHRHEFIKHLLSSRFVPDPADVDDVVDGMTPGGILNFALHFEKDTVLFLYEMRDMVSESERAHVNALIEEEKKHITRITKAQAQL